MRLHHSLCSAIVDNLFAIFVDQKYADKVVEKSLRSNPKWGARDRAFIAEHTYDMVRYARLYWELLERQPTTKPEFWTMLQVHLQHRKILLPEWEEFKNAEISDFENRLRPLLEIRKIRESMPDWLDALGQQEMGEKWEPTLHALNEPAKVVLRTNTLKINSLELVRLLAGEGIETEILEQAALVLTKRANVFQSASFKNGLFEVQDAASQQVAPFLTVEPGMRVVDACAGAGGKTLHLACLMGNKGKIIALDTEAWKLTELEKRARRAGVSNVETRLIDSSKTIKRLHDSADRLLLDVPCSGLGVLRRNPDTKWKLTPQFIENLKVTQQEILSNYSKMLRVGGKMVYATCSILPSENEAQVQWFLSKEGDRFRKLESKMISPSDGFDGFYMALLERIK